MIFALLAPPGWDRDFLSRIPRGFTGFSIAGFFRNSSGLLGIVEIPPAPFFDLRAIWAHDPMGAERRFRSEPIRRCDPGWP
jgi:hypothetical protein